MRSLASGRVPCALSRTSILIGGLFSGASFTTCKGKLVGGRRNKGSGGEGRGGRRLHAERLLVHQLARVISVHRHPQEVAVTRG